MRLGKYQTGAQDHERSLVSHTFDGGLEALMLESMAQQTLCPSSDALSSSEVPENPTLAALVHHNRDVTGTWLSVVSSLGACPLCETALKQPGDRNRGRKSILAHDTDRMSLGRRANSACWT
jgi:hypothetical protein